MMKTVPVEAYYVGKGNEPARLMDDPPVDSVEGAPGSDLAKINALRAFSRDGYLVRSVAFGPKSLVVYVYPKEETPSHGRARTPRSAPSRLK
jgi:hypothetical protein